MEHLFLQFTCLLLFVLLVICDRLCSQINDDDDDSMDATYDDDDHHHHRRRRHHLLTSEQMKRSTANDANLLVLVY